MTLPGRRMHLVGYLIAGPLRTGKAAPHHASRGLCPRTGLEAREGMV